MTERNNFKVDNSGIIFEEEVSEDILCNSQAVFYKNNNLWYVRTRVLIIVAILLILLSIFCSFVGFKYLNKDSVSFGSTTRYDLFVTHSNSAYGGTISSFNKYSSFENAYSYSFSVANNNPVLLRYSVVLENGAFDNNVVDISSINYALLKNNEIVKKGNLSSVKSNVIYDTDIDVNNTDGYVLKFWLPESNSDLKFVFKVNINV